MPSDEQILDDVELPPAICDKVVGRDDEELPREKSDEVVGRVISERILDLPASQPVKQPPDVATFGKADFDQSSNDDAASGKSPRSGHTLKRRKKLGHSGLQASSAVDNEVPDKAISTPCFRKLCGI